MSGKKYFTSKCGDRLDYPGGGTPYIAIIAYTGRLRPKGVPFSGFRYIKG